MEQMQEALEKETNIHVLYLNANVNTVTHITDFKKNFPHIDINDL